MRQLVWIDSGYFVAGVVVEDGVVVRAADVIGYMLKDRWLLERVLVYAEKKKWQYTLMTCEPISNQVTG